METKKPSLEAGNVRGLWDSLECVHGPQVKTMLAREQM